MCSVVSLHSQARTFVRSPPLYFHQRVAVSGKFDKGTIHQIEACKITTAMLFMSAKYNSH